MRAAGGRRVSGGRHVGEPKAEDGGELLTRARTGARHRHSIQPPTPRQHARRGGGRRVSGGRHVGEPKAEDGGELLTRARTGARHRHSIQPPTPRQHARRGGEAGQRWAARRRAEGGRWRRATDARTDRCTPSPQHPATDAAATCAPRGGRRVSGGRHVGEPKAEDGGELLTRARTGARHRHSIQPPTPRQHARRGGGGGSAVGGT